MTLEIRELQKSDFDQWHRLWDGYLDYYEKELSEDIKTTAFERMLDPNTKVNCRLAIDEGEPVGLVHYIFHDHMWRPEGVCYLQDLYADPTIRGKGVGRALIEAVYAEAKSAGSPYVYWLTQDFNKAGRRLYDKVGNLTPFIKYDGP